MHTIGERMFWIVFMPIWLIVTVTLIAPIMWYVLTGRDWIDPKDVYHKIKQNKR